MRGFSRALIILTLFLNLTTLAFAERDWSWAGPWQRYKKSGSKGGGWSFVLGAGARIFQTMGTVVDSEALERQVLWEVQPTFWYSGSFALYGLYGMGLSGGSVSHLGIGAKVAFLSFGRGNSAMFLTADYVVNQGGAVNANLIRYGASLQFALGKSLYFDGTFLLTDRNGQIYMAPFAGLGLRVF